MPDTLLVLYLGATSREDGLTLRIPGQYLYMILVSSNTKAKSENYARFLLEHSGPKSSRNSQSAERKEDFTPTLVHWLHLSFECAPWPLNTRRHRRSMKQNENYKNAIATMIHCTIQPASVVSMQKPTTDRKALVQLVAPHTCSRAKHVVNRRRYVTSQGRRSIPTIRSTGQTLHRSDVKLERKKKKKKKTRPPSTFHVVCEQG